MRFQYTQGSTAVFITHMLQRSWVGSRGKEGTGCCS